MIFGPRPRLIAEIALNLAQPDKVAFRREYHGYSMNLFDIDCSGDRTDTVAKLIDKGVDKLVHHVSAGSGVLVKEAISPAELE
jgi:hypothetical protein